ncbi:hypothetical protein KASHIRA_02490 [Serratia phage vB_SmaM-Kashira]|nr:putative anti-sigma factor [Acinetobacter phage ABPH49]URC22823.1 hypothetical protein KASHIRA_02490 [Serratia phage vB_SmaM-Kashira]
MTLQTQISTIKDVNRAYGYTDCGSLVRKLGNKKLNAADRNIAYDLNFDDLLMMGYKLSGNGTCDYTGLPFFGTDNEAFAPTIERIDDCKGYVRGNIAIVGARANYLKDKFIDKNHQDPSDLELSKDDIKIINAMLPRVHAKGYLEALKGKYIPNFATEEELVKMLDEKWFLPSLHRINDQLEEIAKGSAPEDGNISLQGVGAKLEVPEVDTSEEVDAAPLEIDTSTPAEDEAEKPSLPDDVEIAASYAKLCRALGKVMTVNITFSQYKSIYTNKRCPFTGEELTERYPLILDRSLPLESGNVKMTSNRVGQAMNEFIDATGLSVFELAKNLKKLA